MSKEKKILAVCLVISIISTIIMVVSAIISPETSSLPVIISTGVIPVVLCAAFISLRKNDKE